MKKIMSLVLAGMLIFGTVSLASAHGGSGGFGRNHPNNHRQVNYQDELNLSNSQLDAIEELQDEYYDKTDDVRDELRDKADDLRDLYFDKDSSQDEIIKAQKEVINLRNELAKLRIEYRLKLRDILTEEQLDSIERYGFRGMGSGLDCPGFGGHRGIGRGLGMMNGPGMMGW